MSPASWLGWRIKLARIFITGSTDGLGRAAARSLLDDGHEVVLHARSTERASTLADLASQAAGVAIGDLRSAAEIHRIAEQINAIGYSAAASNRL
jgi:NAD(P)-dependent dehydrogenase (short-subunit alcohol dehydrogenase family)